MILSQRIANVIGDIFGQGTADFGSDGLDDSAAQLRGSLARASAQALKFLWVAAAMLVALFAVMTWLLFQFRSDPAAFTAITGAAGLTFAGLITMMVKIAREHTQGALLAELAARLPPQDAQAVMLALLRGESTGRAAGLLNK